MILLFACAPDLADPAPPAEVELDLSLEAKRVGSGEPLILTARVLAPADWQVEGALSQVEGLSLDLAGEHSEERGERVLVERTFELSGPDGSYVLPGGTWTFTDPEGEAVELTAETLFADIGVGGPSSDLAGLAALPVREATPWQLYAAGAAATVLALAGIAWWLRRRKPQPPPPPPPPPDREALDAWEAVRADPALDDHARALALSRLFRRYLERRSDLPATKLTSFEILEQAELPPECRRSVKRLLSATDLIKFAREGGGEDLFEELDGELRLVIRLTTPAEVAP